MYIYLVSHLFSHLVLTKGLSAHGIHIGHILYNSPNHLGGKKKSLEGSFLPAGRGFDTPGLGVMDEEGSITISIYSVWVYG